MSANYRTAIHWFRRDLRLSDNTGLLQASRSSESIVPTYIVSDWKSSHRWTGAGRQQFLCGCLESLSRNIERIGGNLVIRQGNAAKALETLAKETRAEAIFFNRDPDPYGREMEKKVQEMCRSLGIECHSFKDAVLHEAEDALTGSGTPYKVYTPYSKNWFSLPKDTPAPQVKRLSTPKGIASDPLPTLKTWSLDSGTHSELPESGEKAARERLKRAISGPCLSYAENRNLPAADSTSRLGADLRLGTLSPREVFHRAQSQADQAELSSHRDSLHTFMKQLAWREFFMAILWHFPEVLDEEFAPQWRGLPWDNADDGGKFERWCQGQTGFPIVDAGMRQLAATGFMHNRVRMITAMFLTKDLHVDWRLGEAHFMRHLIDGEIACNNGGWQWSAGTGADAAPYFRIQNPWTQTQRYDPEGEYIKRWVPELREVEPKRFQKPPLSSDPLTVSYPTPLVDHKTERERTLQIFKDHRARHETGAAQ